MRTSIQALSLARSKFGPAPRFSPEDAVRCLVVLERRTGRAALARLLGVGEGTARTVIESLAGKKLVSSSPAGHKLTFRGSALVSAIRANAVSLQPVPASRLTFGKPSHAVQLRGVATGVGSLRLRDEAVRCGAAGAVYFRFERGALFMPPFHSKTHREYARELAAIARHFHFEEGDSLLLAYGGEPAFRERALWRACMLFGI